MPDRPLAIATYAAGASLAAITLVYIFGPSLFSDTENVIAGRTVRKKGSVGLRNPANDCFINAVLQTLAGLPALRLYLVQELYKRSRDGDVIYSRYYESSDDKSDEKPSSNGPEPPMWMRLDQQLGTVTNALKEILDSLNARPTTQKTISAGSFISALESAFRTGLNRNQQDAQEFLQIITERLSDEYQAGERVRRRIKESSIGAGPAFPIAKSPSVDTRLTGEHDSQAPHGGLDFPMQGKIESTITCSYCNFVPKPTVSSFTTLTLHVPQKSTTSLDSCFDGSFMVEQIDDYRCDRCYLQYALEMKKRKLLQHNTDGKHLVFADDIAAIELALARDPENPPAGIEMPAFDTSPKRRVARSSRISFYPKILALHLSRSVWSSHSTSTKNQARITFAEHINLGGLLDRKPYRLLGVITHHGGHNSGHYESYRRQLVQSDITDEDKPDGENSKEQGPTHAAAASADNIKTASEAKADLAGKSSSIADHAHSQDNTEPTCTVHNQDDQHKGFPSTDEGSHGQSTASTDGVARFKENLATRISQRTIKRQQDRWWRISDDKIRECSTRDVLGLQKEVYMLFYELVPEA